jgi:hypothetical protein
MNLGVNLDNISDIIYVAYVRADIDGRRIRRMRVKIYLFPR